MDGATSASDSHHDGSTAGESLLTRIRSQAKPAAGSNSLGIRRTSTRDSYQSAGSGTGEGFTSGGGISGLISSTRSLFKKNNRSGSLSTPSSSESVHVAGPSAVEVAGFAGSSAASNTATSNSPSGSESRRLPPAAAPTSIQLPPPITPDRAFSPPPRRPLADGAAPPPGIARNSSDNTATSSSSSSIPQAGSSSSCATTVSDVEQTSREAHLTSAQPSSAVPATSAGEVGAASHIEAMPLSTEARYRALPRLQSYAVTHPQAGPSSSRDSEDGDAAEYDTTTSMSGTETEQETEHEEEESDAEENEDEEGEDDDEVEDEHEHNEEDVRGGVNAMRTALQRPALPTLSSSRGYSRSGSTPSIASNMNTNPFNFSGWTTFASSTPTPGPLRTARPQSGDNALDGSYFDPRPSSSSSRASTLYQTPAETPRGETVPSSNGSATKTRQQFVTVPIPGGSMSPSSSRVRLEASRPSSGSPLAPGRQTSSGTFVLTGNGQHIPPYAIPSVPGFSPGNSGSNGTSTRSNPASISNRPSFYQRQSRSLVDLSRPSDLSDAGISAFGSPARTKATASVSSDLSRSASSNPAEASGSALSPEPSSSSSAVVNASAAEVEPAQAAETEQQFELETTAAQAELGSSTQSAVVVSPPAPPFFSAVSKSPPPASGVSSPGSRAQSPSRTMQRRQSMPEMRIDPPLYQIDDDFNVQYRAGQLPSAREDEGHEALPSYTCDVHIEGYVPRKMEFVKPGIQAKDRRWKRQYVILHGTSVKVYKSDPRLKAVPGEGPPPTPGVHTDKHRPSFGSTASKTSSMMSKTNNHPHHRMAQASRARAPTESSISSASSVESEKALMWNQAVQEAIAKKKYDPDMPVHVHLQEEDEHGLASLQHAPSTLLAKASENRCIRHYTLQGAESGLAADYLKRRHVVRVRAEGEQFLIQCKDDRAVIDWIEALQAATNTALDLDVRPLPKFITLPRRRRRRRPADPNNPNAAATNSTNGGATGAGATSGAPAGATASAAASAPRNDSTEVSASSDAMNAMLAEDQDAYLGSNRTALG